MDTVDVLAYINSKASLYPNCEIFCRIPGRCRQEIKLSAADAADLLHGGSVIIACSRSSQEPTLPRSSSVILWRHGENNSTTTQLTTRGSLENCPLPWGKFCILRNIAPKIGCHLTASRPFCGGFECFECRYPQIYTVKKLPPDLSTTAQTCFKVVAHDNLKQQRNKVCTLLKNAKSEYVNLAVGGSSDKSKNERYQSEGINPAFNPPRLH